MKDDANTVQHKLERRYDELEKEVATVPARMLRFESDTMHRRNLGSYRLQNPYKESLFGGWVLHHVFNYQNGVHVDNIIASGAQTFGVSCATIRDNWLRKLTSMLGPYNVRDGRLTLKVLDELERLEAEKIHAAPPYKDQEREKMK